MSGYEYQAQRHNNYGRERTRRRLNNQVVNKNSLKRKRNEVNKELKRIERNEAEQRKRAEQNKKKTNSFKEALRELDPFNRLSHHKVNVAYKEYANKMKRQGNPITDQEAGLGKFLDTLDVRAFAALGSKPFSKTEKEALEKAIKESGSRFNTYVDFLKGVMKIACNNSGAQEKRKRELKELEAKVKKLEEKSKRNISETHEYLTALAKIGHMKNEWNTTRNNANSYNKKAKNALQRSVDNECEKKLVAKVLKYIYKKLGDLQSSYDEISDEKFKKLLIKVDVMRNNKSISDVLKSGGFEVVREKLKQINKALERNKYTMKNKKIVFNKKLGSSIKKILAQIDDVEYFTKDLDDMLKKKQIHDHK